MPDHRGALQRPCPLHRRRVHVRARGCGEMVRRRQDDVSDDGRGAFRGSARARAELQRAEPRGSGEGRPSERRCPPRQRTERLGGCFGGRVLGRSAEVRLLLRARRSPAPRRTGRALRADEDAPPERRRRVDGRRARPPRSRRARPRPIAPRQVSHRPRREVRRPRRRRRPAPRQRVDPEEDRRARRVQERRGVDPAVQLRALQRPRTRQGRDVDQGGRRGTLHASRGRVE